jgi:hypothetical protein
MRLHILHIDFGGDNVEIVRCLRVLHISSYTKQSKNSYPECEPLRLPLRSSTNHGQARATMHVKAVSHR